MAFTVMAGRWANGVNPGEYTRVRCPACSGKIVYNGNYFCEYWGTVISRQRVGGDCDWALPHPADNDLDRWLSWILSGYVEGVETWSGRYGWQYSGDDPQPPGVNLSKLTDPERFAHYTELIRDRVAALDTPKEANSQ
jgi:hypothetical protein